MFRPWLVFLCLLLGCASTGPMLEFCDEQSVEAAIAPTPDCEAQAEVAALLVRLGTMIEGEADPLEILVGFDDRSGVETVCAVRSSAPKQWAAFSRMQDEVGAIYETGAGPACLSGRTWSFNQAGALIGAVEELIRDCRDSTRSGLAYRECLDIEQARRNELWFMSTRFRDPFIFVSAENPAARRVAVDRCSDALIIDPRDREHQIGITRNHRRLAECLREQGWQPAFRYDD